MKEQMVTRWVVRPALSKDNIFYLSYRNKIARYEWNQGIRPEWVYEGNREMVILMHRLERAKIYKHRAQLKVFDKKEQVAELLGIKG